MGGRGRGARRYGGDAGAAPGGHVRAGAEGGHTGDRGRPGCAPPGPPGEGVRGELGLGRPEARLGGGGRCLPGPDRRCLPRCSMKSPAVVGVLCTDSQGLNLGCKYPSIAGGWGYRSPPHRRPRVGGHRALPHWSPPRLGGSRPCPAWAPASFHFEAARPCPIVASPLLGCPRGPGSTTAVLSFSHTGEETGASSSSHLNSGFLLV